VVAPTSAGGAADTARTTPEEAAARREAWRGVGKKDQRV
jgi:hypothetical protein